MHHFTVVFVSRMSPRVALCLAGHPRTFTRPHVHGSILQNLVGGLGGEVDVFAVLGIGDANPKQQQKKWQAPSVAFDEHALTLALDSLRPRSVVRTNSSWLRPNPACKSSPTKFMEHNLERVLAQPASWATCYQELSRLEGLSDPPFRYEWVVRTRPDLFWLDRHPSVWQLRGMRARAAPRMASPVGDRRTREQRGQGKLALIMNQWPCDQHFALPRAAARSIMEGMARGYAAGCPTGSFERWPNLESWLLASLNATANALGAPLVQFSFPFAVVRNSSLAPSAREFCQRGEAYRKDEKMQLLRPGVDPVGNCLRMVL